MNTAYFHFFRNGRLTKRQVPFTTAEDFLSKLDEAQRWLDRNLFYHPDAYVKVAAKGYSIMRPIRAVAAETRNYKISR